MIGLRVPAGTLDDNGEVFVDPRDTEICYVQISSMVYRVNDAPNPFVGDLLSDMELHPKKLEALVLLGYETQPEQIEKYAGCCFGGHDYEPDYIDGKFVHAEYWPCPKRGTCPVEGVLCNALSVGNGKYLSTREIEVLSLIADADKIIADKLSISIETVKVHKRHICEKTGCLTKVALALFARDKHLI